MPKKIHKGYTKKFAKRAADLERGINVSAGVPDREPAEVREQLYSGRHEAVHSVIQCAMLYVRARRAYEQDFNSRNLEALAIVMEKRYVQLLAAVNALGGYAGYSPVDR